MRLPVIAPDKANHFVYGATVAALGGLHSVAAGAVACVVVAVAKELHDRKTRTGTPELADALWTVLGGAVALLPLAAWRLGIFTGA